MIPKQFAVADLLLGVAELTLDVAQRIPPPVGQDDAHGVYGALTNGQRVALHLNEAVRGGIGALSGALLRHGALNPRHREIIIVRIGYVEGSVYEIVQHRSLAERVGVPAATLDALACRTPPGLEAAETALVAFVDEQLARSRVGDAALAAMRAHFSEQQVIEAIVVTGMWWMLARMVDTAGAPVDERRIGADGVSPTR